jgi:hypothetical protein
LLGGFVLLPILTAPGVWRLAGATMAALSLAAVAWQALERHGRGAKVIPILAAIAAIALCFAPAPTSIWRHSAIGAGRSGLRALSGNGRLEWLRATRSFDYLEFEGREASVAIRRGQSTAFYVYSKSDGNAIADADTQIMLGMVGATLHSNPRTALVVGLGTGETAGWLAACETMERVDCVELEPAVVAMAEICAAANQHVLDNPKLRLIFDDAREVLLVAGPKYDLIVSEPSNPYRVGVASLFTSEFYQAARDRLNSGGTFGQWLQAYEVDVQTVALVFQTLARVFAHVVALGFSYSGFDYRFALGVFDGTTGQLDASPGGAIAA